MFYVAHNTESAAGQSMVYGCDKECESVLSYKISACGLLDTTLVVYWIRYTFGLFTVLQSGCALMPYCKLPTCVYLVNSLHMLYYHVTITLKINYLQFCNLTDVLCVRLQSKQNAFKKCIQNIITKG